MLAAAATLLACPALAQPRLPGKTVRIIVPFAPGGISDIVARMMADALSGPLGQPVVVENRSGAGGNIGAEYVARSAPDGATLLAASPSVMAIAKPLYPKLNYDPDTELVPVGMMGAQANVLLTSPRALTVPTLEGLVKAAKERPGAVNFGSSGAGSLAHLTGVLFAADAGIEMTHVPYRGSPPAVADLVSGQIQMLFDAVTTALPLAEAGSLRMLGTATAARQPAIPAVPSLVELGYQRSDAPNWFCLFAPSATPPATLAMLRGAVEDIAASPGWAQQMQARSATTLPYSGARLDEFLATERARWAETVRRSGATVE
ncbi:tripartite tricarboxylate transporter substrate binding protein [Roseomonas sp. OT10]|uniref:Bug family tripartite tricarboxylate transporter substrate binding protein n=1 Tax=Roseomonas cutis TaxID=2897332 RepID=UPI001E5B9506|nr:tripartite tricarboxylate transporter substrate binding protein [Roseomonas sp. OT10]UFN50550.1 tripartite tricarboxylate transporter substrate binding protein [Roseomonas sp. OT10]